MAAGEQPGDPSLRDLAWVGYHPRAALPSFALALLATTVVLIGRWSVVSEADRIGALAFFALAWAVWPGLVLVFLYRTVTFTYRLTDRVVLADFGMFARPVAAIALAEVVDVAAGGNWPGRLLGIGWVEVRTRARVLRLPGVRGPDEFAEKIRAAAKRHLSTRNG